ncbi:tyrosine decarboxylase [Nakamurella antarctica]|uniref:Tyrosine decarboxylase n=1 Tax=Nakamurella antarctica TaxID=1902245 RepID=A0A3G8ZJ02_9ACTN|nr:tyrosine decarboxylase [Nakamurella antarctica]AZI57200.1 tyrosine decarboxylase [Nakamurella antarctica]
MSDIDYRALFIGDQAENGPIFKELLEKLVDEHIGWRQNYMPGDRPGIAVHDKSMPEYEAAQERMREVMSELSQRLRAGSVPWNSAGRYWGHMNAETLMPAILAYTFAMLWNPNNVALESSMATSKMEAEVGADFAKLFGFDEGWGHISADGSIANLEGLWYARSLKSIPLALAETLPETVAGKSEWELLNMSVEEILDLLDTLTPEQYDEVKGASSRSGRNINRLGKWLVPETKHYSWLKAADIIGVGLDQLVAIPVSDNYRMDIEALTKIVEEMAQSRTPILGLVTVVGTTEEGAVDEVDKIIALRDRMRASGLYFYIHCDAAYGGYARSLFFDTDGRFVDYPELSELHQSHGIFSRDLLVSEEVYAGFKAISQVESVTVDPHKMGYVPYAAGGIAIRLKKMRNVISYFAPYVFDKGVVAPDMLGAFTLEGSRAGATAASVWAAHRCLPLDVSGYGRLIASGMQTAHRFRDFLADLKFTVAGRVVRAFPLHDPDFNMVDWVFKADDMTTLEEVNDLNQKMYDLSSYLAGHEYNNIFITSHTTFSRQDYGDSPAKFIHSLGFDDSEWGRVKSVTLLRASILDPYLNSNELFSYYTTAIEAAFNERLSEVLSG